MGNGGDGEAHWTDMKWQVKCYNRQICYNFLQWAQCWRMNGFKLKLIISLCQTKREKNERERERERERDMFKHKCHGSSNLLVFIWFSFFFLKKRVCVWVGSEEKCAYHYGYCHSVNRSLPMHVAAIVCYALGQRRQLVLFENWLVSYGPLEL